jgi:ubiquinone/menaquinone biosynthesis C-methylase UbiE
MQWYATMLPRIHRFLPAGSILEIGPGFGRWTQFLKDHCPALTVVDLCPVCIEHCQSRFAASSHIRYHVNDGRSLAMIPDASVDFVFSFDSLVHAEADVIDAYLCGLSRVLKKGGVGFIHHSNFGAFVPGRFAQSLAATRFVRRFRNPRWRAESVSAETFSALCRKHGIRCTGQEIINWRGRLLVDCLSTVTRAGSRWSREPVVVKNRGFMKEAAAAKRLSRIYGCERNGEARQ